MLNLTVRDGPQRARLPDRSPNGRDASTVQAAAPTGQRARLRIRTRARACNRMTCPLRMRVRCSQLAPQPGFTTQSELLSSPSVASQVRATSAGEERTESQAPPHPFRDAAWE